jgi:hypothetical protein
VAAQAADALPASESAWVCAAAARLAARLLMEPDEASIFPSRFPLVRRRAV